MKLQKRRQRDDDANDKFLDDLELLSRRSDPDRRISERKLALGSQFIDGVKSDELKTMLTTHFTLSADSDPTPDELRMKSREYLLINPRAQNRYNNYGNLSAGDAEDIPKAQAVGAAEITVGVIIVTRQI